MAVTITSGDTINITVTQSASSSVTITSKGPKGDTGETGATGATGATGTAGAAGKTYTISCVDGDNSDEEKIRLTDSDGTTDDVVLEASTGMSIARSGDKITFTNTVTDTNTQLTTEQVQDIIGGMLTGNTETRISVTYDDTDGTIDFVVDDMTATGISNLVEDSTPQLGGALDTNGNAIQFRDTGDTNYVELKASTLEPSSNVTFFLPIADGSNGQVLQTNGSGRLSFTTVSSSYKLLQTYSYSDTGTTDKFFVQNATTELSGSNAARDYRSAYAIPVAGSVGDCTMVGASAVDGNAYRLYVWVNNTSTYYAEATGGNEVGSRYTVRWTSWKNVSDDSTASDPSFSANDYLAFQLVPTASLSNPGSASLSVLTSHT